MCRHAGKLSTRPDSVHWNDPMADNLPAVLIDGYSQRRKSGKNHLKESIRYRIATLLRADMKYVWSTRKVPKVSNKSTCFWFTFLKTMGSSSHTGLTALPGDVFVRNAFLFVSTGRPNISTSTYVPTFLSDRNCPDMICGKNCESHDYCLTFVAKHQGVFLMILLFLTDS